MAKGRSGAYRQTTLTHQQLLQAQNHEERKDLVGKTRSVENRPPLVWSEGKIEEPAGWKPGNWDSTLVPDYERHVAGARFDQRAGKLCVHAILQWPTEMEMTPDIEQMMVQKSVDFVQQMNGEDAVFHARLDRDERGKHVVDVFFAPKFEKVNKKGEKTGTWVSLSRFAKQQAKMRGYREGAVDRGRMFQDAWAGYLQHEIGLDWVERGRPKAGISPDRVSPEEYAADQERQKIERERVIFETECAEKRQKIAAEHAALEAKREKIKQERKDVGVLLSLIANDDLILKLDPERPENPLRVELGNYHMKDAMRIVDSIVDAAWLCDKETANNLKKFADSQKALKKDQARFKAERIAVNAYMDGSFLGFNEDRKLLFAKSTPNERRTELSRALADFYQDVLKVLEPLARMFEELKIGLSDRKKEAPRVMKAIRARRDFGFE